MSDKPRILVADPSKVARSALAKHLQDDFDVREESDGESAWQTLVLDASIVAVVSGINLSRMSGHDLLSRLRDSRVRRLNDIPFFLLVSKDQGHPKAPTPDTGGVCDYIVRGMSGDEIRQRIARQLDWEIAPAPDNAGTAPSFIDRKAVCRRVCDILADRSANDDMPISILAFGLEDETGIAQRFGESVMLDIGEKIGRVIGEKIGRNNFIGHARRTVYLIVSPGTPVASASAFAQRVCRAIGEQSLLVAGQRAQVAVSAGIASLPDDSGLTASQLIDLALMRLALARQTSGGQVVANDPPPDSALARIQEELASIDHGTPFEQVSAQLMQLIRQYEQRFQIGLPLTQIEEAFRRQASQTPCDR